VCSYHKTILLVSLFGLIVIVFPYFTVNGIIGLVIFKGLLFLGFVLRFFPVKFRAAFYQWTLHYWFQHHHSSYIFLPFSFGPRKTRVLCYQQVNEYSTMQPCIRTDVLYVWAGQRAGSLNHQSLGHDICWSTGTWAASSSRCMLSPQCACDNDRLTWDYLLRVLETHLQIFSLILTYVKIECNCKIIKANKSKGCLVSCNVVRGLSCVHAIPCSFMSCSPTK